MIVCKWGLDWKRFKKEVKPIVDIIDAFEDGLLILDRAMVACFFADQEIRL